MASLNLNKVILAGRLTAAPELKSTPNGVNVVRFTVAVNRRHTKDEQPQTDFISAVAWRQTAEFVSKYFGKGSSICVVGFIQTSTSTDQNGQKRYWTDVVAQEVHFVDSRTDTPRAAQKPASEACNSPSGDMVDIGEDEDLPF